MDVIARIPPLLLIGSVFALGVLVGKFLTGRIWWLATGDARAAAGACSGCGDHPGGLQWLATARYMFLRGRCRRCGQPLNRSGLVTELGTGLLFAVYVLAYTQLDCQSTPKVTPDPIWYGGRIVIQLILISLLVLATGTDLLEYVIPDQITVTGMLIGLATATLSGDTQIIHVWVDWNLELPGVEGAYVPKWAAEHRHWHGLAWSVLGLLAGGGITWAARIVSSFVLGQQALGFGDVTFMAMIGSFVGWQPVVFVFLIAPFCGVVVSLTVKLLTHRPYVPYGPFLAAATFVVLCSWRWLWLWEPAPWFSVRRLFGDWPSLLVLAGISLGAMFLLLGMLRLYRVIPGKSRETHADAGSDADTAG